MGKSKPFILPPMEGVSYEMDETYLSNLKGSEPPHGEPVELHLFVVRFIRKQKQRNVYTITAATESIALRLLEEFASRPDVHIVEEKTRKPVPKEWLTKEPA